jgi:hypothetical protein
MREKVAKERVLDTANFQSVTLRCYKNSVEGSLVIAYGVVFSHFHFGLRGRQGIGIVKSGSSLMKTERPALATSLDMHHIPSSQNMSY